LQVRTAYWKGFKASAPLLLGIFPFAMIVGTMAVAAGMTLASSFGLSLFVFAGASQLAIIDLVGKEAPMFILIITALVINMRFLIYSAGMAPHFKGLKVKHKAMLSYLLTDQAYILGVSNFEKGAEKSQGMWYYLGAASALWIVWQIGTAAGIFLGKGAPESWGLDFAVPLSFIALLVPTLKNKASGFAAATAAAAILLVNSLPMNMGLIVAVIIGVASGLIISRKGDLI